MAILDYFIKKEKPTVVQEQSSSSSSFESFASSINYDTNVELQTMTKTGNGYLFGANGLFPQDLNKLYHQSPLHSAILDFKKLLTAGNGFTILNSALSTSDLISLNQLTSQFEKIAKDVAMDYFIHSRICLQITWNSDNTKILKVERIAPEKIRINDLDGMMEPISFLYNWDWSNASKYKTLTIPVFEQENAIKKQLYFFQVTSAGQKLYSEPQYKSCLPWIFLDSESAVYHKSNIVNSLSPSYFLQMYENPSDEEEKQKVKSRLQSTFGGAKNAGKLMVHFADGKEFAPTLTPLEPSKLDKTFLSLGDTIGRQICYSHHIDPQLLGLKIAGSLGNSGEFEIAYNIFNKSIIQPAQADIEKIFNELISINRLATKIKFNEVEIYKSQKTQS